MGVYMVWETGKSCECICTRSCRDEEKGKGEGALHPELLAQKLFVWIDKEGRSG